MKRLFDKYFEFGLFLFLFTSFSLCSCSNDVYTLKTAFDVVIHNDKNSLPYFSYFSDNTVSFDSNPEQKDDFFNYQCFLNLKMFMAMLDFPQDSFVVIFDSINDCVGGEIQEKYFCSWLSDGSKRVLAKFSEVV